MAVHCEDVGDGLTRDAGTFINFGSAWSMCMWAWIDALPGLGEEIVLWHYGDITGTNDYIRLSIVHDAVFGVARLRLAVKTTTVSTVDSSSAFRANQWAWCGMRRSNAGTGFTQHWDGGEATVVKASPSLVETDEHLGTDGSSKAGVRFAYVRHFQLNAIAAATVHNERTDYAAFGLGNAALADTPLPDTGDLADDSGNGRDWSAVGTPTDAPDGPLDFTDNSYVQGVFKDDFNDQNPNSPNLYKWNHATAFGVRQVGCNLSMALSCANGQNWRGLPTGYTSLTYRCQVAPRLQPSSEWAHCIILGPPRQTLATFQAVIYLKGDGAVMVRLTGPSGSLFFSSAAGLFNAANGAWHSVQIEAYCDDDEQRIVYYLDNEEVLDTGAVSTSGLVAGKWRRISRFNVNPLHGSASGAIDNVQAEPGINVITWRACPALPFTSCTPTIPSAPSGGLGPLAWVEARWRTP